MSTPILTKSYRAAAAIAGYLIVAAAGAGKSVGVATGPTDLLIGAAGEQGAELGGMLDIDLVGISKVRFGDDVDFGDPLTSDADGKAVKAEPVEGGIVRVIGYAMTDAADGDIGDYFVAPCIIATPAA